MIILFKKMDEPLFLKFELSGSTIIQSEKGDYLIDNIDVDITKYLVDYFNDVMPGYELLLDNTLYFHYNGVDELPENPVGYYLFELQLPEVTSDNKIYPNLLLVNSAPCDETDSESEPDSESDQDSEPFSPLPVPKILFLIK